MKAIAIFPDKKSVELIDHPALALDGPTSVRLRIREVGICGTDEEICSFDYGTPPDGSPYLLIGPSAGPAGQGDRTSAIPAPSPSGGSRAGTAT